MAEKRYYWLKLFDDFFTSKRIKKLRNLAGGDTYTIIYLKMQLKSLKDEGYLYFDGVMDDFAEELALDIDEKPEDVKITIQYLLSVGLLETNNDEVYKLTFMDRLIGSETASTQRVRDFRERQKEQKALHCNANETQVKQVGNVEIDIEKEIELDIEKEKDIETRSNSLSESISDKKSDKDEIVEMWNSLEPYGIKPIRGISKGSKRLDMVNARLKQYTLGDIETAIDNIRNSDFLQGKVTDFVITFDWFIKPNNFIKVLEGNYDKRSDNSSKKSGSAYIDAIHNRYDVIDEWLSGKENKG